MTIKQRIREALLREPMTTREVATAIGIDLRLAGQLIYEMSESLARVETKTNHRNQQCYVWGIREKA